MSLILTLEHAYAASISELKKAAKVIQGPVLAVLEAAHAEAPTIEAVTGLVSPQLENLERTGDALLGAAIKAIDDAEAAGEAGGLSISLDSALVADIKAIIPLVKANANTTAVAGK